MSITALIVNYHTAHLLPPLTKVLHESPLISEIIIVDNSNELHDVALHEIASNKANVILNRFNKGFAAAANQGFSLSGTEWLLLVNPDVRLDEASIQQLLAGAENLGAPLVGPRFYWNDDKTFRLPPATGSCQWLNFAGQCAEKDLVEGKLYSFYWALRNDQFWRAEEPFPEPFLSGACLLIKKSWIRQLKQPLFDERYFLYYEDTDLCVRALKNGQYPFCIPDAGVVHYYNQTPTPDRVKQGLMNDSSRHFIQKYFGEMARPNFLPGKVSNTKEMDDMGEFHDTSPVFSGFPFQDGEIKFEMAANRYFVPFAQSTIINRTVFSVPFDIWKRLSPGTYFSRCRSGMKVIKEWKWKRL